MFQLIGHGGTSIAVAVRHGRITLHSSRVRVGRIGRIGGYAAQGRNQIIGGFGVYLLTSLGTDVKSVGRGEKKERQEDQQHGNGVVG